VSDGTANAPVDAFDCTRAPQLFPARSSLLATGLGLERGNVSSSSDDSPVASHARDSSADFSKFRVPIVLGGANLRGATGIEALATCRIDVGVSDASDLREREAAKKGLLHAVKA
jgi:hypothetical protein